MNFMGKLNVSDDVVLFNIISDRIQCIGQNTYFEMNTVSSQHEHHGIQPFIFYVHAELCTSLTYKTRHWY